MYLCYDILIENDFVKIFICGHVIRSFKYLSFTNHYKQELLINFLTVKSFAAIEFICV